MGATRLREQKMIPDWTIPSWSRMVRADDVDVTRANKELKQLIAHGATGVAIIFEGAHNAYRFGLPAKPDTIERLFNGIDLTGLHLRLDNHPHGAALSNPFVEFLQRNITHPQKTKITFGIDPAASLATCGRLKMSIAALKASQPQSMSAFFASGLPGIILEADGRPYHHAGGSPAQELGVMLCVADEHLDMVESGRHPAIYALPHIGFATALDSDFKAGLVKLQALQLLWQRLQHSRGITEPMSAQIHVETSRRMLVSDNIALNNTRNHYAAIAAIVGGAASLSILPPQTPLGLPDTSARSASLISQLVLASETQNFRQLKFNLETEINNLSQKAWTYYQDFKANDGVIQCLIDGSLSRQLAQTHKKQQDQLNNVLGFPEQHIEKEGFCLYDAIPTTVEVEGIKHCDPLIPVYRA